MLGKARLIGFPSETANDRCLRRDVPDPIDAARDAVPIGIVGIGQRYRFLHGNPDVRSEVLRILGGVAARSTLVGATSRREFDEAARDGSIVRIARGRYALPAAHEGLVVPADGTVDAVNVQLDARGYKPVAHRNKFGRPYPASRDRY